MYWFIFFFSMNFGLTHSSYLLLFQQIHPENRMVRMRKRLALKAAVTEARDYARLTRNRRKRSRRQLQRLNNKVNIIDHTLEPNTNARESIKVQHADSTSLQFNGIPEPPTTDNPPCDLDECHHPNGFLSNSLQTHNSDLSCQDCCRVIEKANTCREDSSSHSQLRKHNTHVCSETMPSHGSRNIASEEDISSRTRSRTRCTNNASHQTSTDDHCSIDIMSQEDNSDITPSELKAELKNCGDHKVRRDSARTLFLQLFMDLFLNASVVTFSVIITAVCR